MTTSTYPVVGRGRSSERAEVTGSTGVAYTGLRGLDDPATTPGTRGRGAPPRDAAASQLTSADSTGTSVSSAAGPARVGFDDSWVKRRIDELSRIAKEDYGLTELNPKSVSMLWLVVDALSETPDLHEAFSDAFISLIFEGELQIEWGHSGAYLELELRGDGSLRTLLEFRDRTFTPELWEPRQILEGLRWLGHESA